MENKEINEALDEAQRNFINNKVKDLYIKDPERSSIDNGEFENSAEIKNRYLKEAVEVLCNALREDRELYNKIVSDFENTTIKYIKDNHVNWMDIEVYDNEKFKNILNIFTKNFLNLLINK